MNEQNKSTLKTVGICILAVVVIAVVGISFAYFTVNYEIGDTYSIGGKASNTNPIIEFSENKSGISLDGTYPMPDEVGLNKSDEYTFTVTSKEAESYVKVDVYMQVASSNTLADNLVNIAFNGEVKTVGSLETGVSIDDGFNKAYKIGSFILNKNGSKSNSVKMWVNESGTVENALGKSWNSKIYVIPSFTDEVPQYQVTFDPNGGSVDITNKTVSAGGTYGELPTPTREGYYFVGWYTDSSSGNKVNFDTNVIINENQTLYAHWVVPEPLVPKLLAQANAASITDYNSGVKGEMYTFSHDATEQTEALTDYRYIGNEPNNYIQFNNEIWRIIGVFTVEGENEQGETIKEQRIKIIRDESIGDLAWDSNEINEWPTSSLSTLLNTGDYYTRNGTYETTGLTDTAKSQIALAKWYLGGNNTGLNLGGADYYSFERGTSVCTGNSTNIIANVGLMYPSDYVYTYSNGVDNKCYTDGFYCNKGTPLSGWLFNSSDQWTITPHSSYSHNAFMVFDGSVFSDEFFNMPLSYGVRPSTYLRSDIEIVSGTGAENDPYILKA